MLEYWWGRCALTPRHHQSSWWGCSLIIRHHSLTSHQWSGLYTWLPSSLTWYSIGPSIPLSPYPLLGAPQPRVYHYHNIIIIIIQYHRYSHHDLFLLASPLSLSLLTSSPSLPSSWRSSIGVLESHPCSSSPCLTTPSPQSPLPSSTQHIMESPHHVHPTVYRECTY